jgi:maleamate amidohydrolase
MTDAYKAIGFESHRIGYGRRAGVVVVDFQKGFTDSRFPLGGSAMVDRAVDNTAKLVAAARTAGLPIACCYTAYSSAREAPLWKIPVVVNEFHHGRESTELDERIYDKNYDMIVCKSAPSIFFNTPVAAYFIKDGVDTVIVSGCNTSGCVRATIVDAFSYGFRVIVPEQCCGDVEEQPHRDNLRDVQRRYADVVELDEVLSYIAASAQEGFEPHLFKPNPVMPDRQFSHREAKLRAANQ